VRKVFISYARANKSAVDELVEHLRELGCETWVDSALYGGQDWWQEILRRIADCDVFIPIISHDALNSVACAREFDWAEALAKPVLPVAIEPPSVALPTRFSRRQFIDYSKSAERDRAARRLGGGLMSLPPAPPLPRPAPPRPAAPLSYLTDLVDMVSRAKPLHPEEQRQILVRLKPALRSLDPEERRGGLAVLDRFGSRADLASDIDRSIAALKQHNDDANRIPQAPPPPRVRPTESHRPVQPIPPRPQFVRTAAADPTTKRATQGRPQQSSKSGPLYSNLGAPGWLLLLAALSGVIPPLVAIGTSYGHYPIQVWWLQTSSRILLGLAFCILAARAATSKNDMAAFSGWLMLPVVAAYTINDVVTIRHLVTYGEGGPDDVLNDVLRVYVYPSLLGLTALVAVLFGTAVIRVKPAAWAAAVTLWGVCGVVEAILSYLAKVDGSAAPVADYVLILQNAILFAAAVLMPRAAPRNQRATA
jgi:TIR domain